MRVPAATPLVTLAVLAAIVRIWLAAGVASSVQPYAVDDYLYMRLADHLVHGEWLGPYDATTLVKSMGYPLFLAGASVLGVPRRLAEDGLLVVACMSLLWALRRLGVSRLLAGVAYMLCLFSPIMMASILNRPLREWVYGSQTLLLVALGLALIPPDRMRRRLAISIVLGLVAAWTWHTREEGAWLLPGFVIFGAGLVISEWRRSGRLAHAAGIVALLLIPVILPTQLATAAIRWRNERDYGIAVTVELQEPGFEAAIGALSRVAPDEWLPMQPISRDALEQCYAASPSLRSLRSILDGEVNREPQVLGPNGERILNYLTWAIRHAASKGGKHQSAGEASRFYRAIGDEINRACDSGTIAAGPRRDSYLPRMDLSAAGDVPEVAWEFLCSLWRFDINLIGTNPRLPRDTAPDAWVRLGRRVLGESMRPDVRHFHARMRINRVNVEAHRRILPWMAVLGLAGWLTSLLVGRRRLAPGLHVAVLFVLTLLVTRIMMIAVLRVYVMRTAGNYLVPAWFLLPVFSVLGIAAGWAAVSPASRAWRRLGAALTTSGGAIGLTVLIIGGTVAGSFHVWNAASSPAPGEPAILALDSFSQVDFGDWRVIPERIDLVQVAGHDDMLVVAPGGELPRLRFHVIDPDRTDPSDVLLTCALAGISGARKLAAQVHCQTEQGMRVVPHVFEVSGAGPEEHRISLGVRRILSVVLFIPNEPGLTLQLAALKPVPRR